MSPEQLRFVGKAVKVGLLLSLWPLATFVLVVVPRMDAPKDAVPAAVTYGLPVLSVVMAAAAVLLPPRLMPIDGRGSRMREIEANAGRDGAALRLALCYQLVRMAMFEGIAFVGVTHAIVTRSVTWFGVGIAVTAIGVLASRLPLDQARAALRDAVGRSAQAAGPS